MTTNSGQEHAGEGVRTRKLIAAPPWKVIAYIAKQRAALEKLTRERDEARAHTPHFYSPSVMHMGDCSICGCEQDSPNHHTDWDRPAATARIAALEAENARLVRERDFYKRKTRNSFGFTYEPTGERATIYAEDYRSIEIFLYEPGVCEMMRHAEEQVREQQAARAILGEQP